MIRALAGRLRCAVRPSSDPHECLVCRARTRRPTASQRAMVAAGMAPSCPWCGGPVWALAARQEQALRTALVTVAAEVAPQPGGLERIRDQISRTAAPGGAGAAARFADGCKEPNDMSHDLAFETTTGGRQMIAALALAHLLEQRLPDAEWTIATEPAGLLDGVIDADVPDDQTRADLARFAEFLGAEVETEPFGCLVVWHRVTGTYRGAQVRISARTANGGKGR
ncbi:hypothetical protein [Actinomadura hibisca]|uniref:hypothetical protein n=1 Tax=Actinomadura hibisca TaxID=68565 RepID=UPI00082E6536|nr:hypothetical protein [Actinomadura hibisca]